MQYNGYNLQIVDDGCIIRDNKGNYLLMVDTEDEAYEYIDNVNNKEVKLPNTGYDKFIQYCNKLPGKCFINEKLATTNERALKRFISSFEKSSNYKVFTSTDIIDGEYLFTVISVE